MIDVAIDISDAQSSKIDWKAVFASGIRIAFIKAMEGAATGYPTWGPQSSGARAAGLVVPPYIFLRPNHPVNTVIANFCAVTMLTKGSMFALDWEGRASQTCTPADAEAIGLGLSKVTGRVPIGYWGLPGSTPAQPTKIMQTWNRWIPRYPQSPEPANFAAMTSRAVAKKPAGALFWQYTSAGRVPGIAGPVDRSVFCGDESQLESWIKTGQVPG